MGAGRICGRGTDGEHGWGTDGEHRQGAGRGREEEAVVEGELVLVDGELVVVVDEELVVVVDVLHLRMTIQHGNGEIHSMMIQQCLLLHHLMRKLDQPLQQKALIHQLTSSNFSLPTT